MNGHNYSPFALFVTALILLCLPFAFISVVVDGLTPDDPWTYDDDTPIVCRVQGCGKRPSSHEWEYRFCMDHYGRIKGSTCRYNSCREEPLYDEYWRMYCGEHIMFAKR